MCIRDRYGISSVEECRDICKAKGFDPYEIVSRDWSSDVCSSDLAKQNVFSAIFRANAKEEARMREETMELLKEQGDVYKRQVHIFVVIIGVVSINGQQREFGDQLDEIGRAHV